MFNLSIKMLLEDKTKYIGLLIGLAFTSFLVTFAMAYFAGFMTRSFALIEENPTADVWVMDNAVKSSEATINMSNASLCKIKSIYGVNNASALYIQDMKARFVNGNFQTFQIIGVDDVQLSGAPQSINGLTITEALHIPYGVVVASGGTNNKLKLHLKNKTRDLRFGDTLLIENKKIFVSAMAQILPRFPPRPLIYTTISNFKRLTPSQSKRTTFVMIKINKGISAKKVALNIQKQTGLKALTKEQFKKQTVLWFLANSEDVGDMVNMIVLAMIVGFGASGIMLYMFTQDHFKQYAILKAMGVTYSQLKKIVWTQIFVSAFIGSGIGIGVCTLFGIAMSSAEFPYRLMYFAPLSGLIGVLIVSFISGSISIRTLNNLEPAIVFSN